jgi:hypothetical protein
MTGPTQINHRRDRHEVRRILARVVVRGRDLTKLSFRRDFDFIDYLRRLAANENREVVFALTAARKRQ